MLRAILEIIQIGIKQYGAMFALVGFVCFILWYVLKHVIKESVIREKEQRIIINNQIKELKAYRRQTRKFHQQETEDHKKMSKGLNEIVTALGRINGYKS